MKSFLTALSNAAKEFGRWLAHHLRSIGSALGRAARSVRESTVLERAVHSVVALLRSVLRIAVTSGAGAGLVLGGLFLCFQRVPPASIGVRQTQWGGGGLVERDFEPGMHFSLKGWHAWHFLDRRTHFVFFGASEQGAEDPILDLRTKQGNEIKVGLLVPYRIAPGKAHALVADGLKGSYREIARATIRDVMMQELAELTADEFASTEARLARTSAALPRLNQLLARFHLQAESIQIHDVVFWAQYDKILQQKQLTRQHALLAQAGAQVEEELRRNTLDQDIVKAENGIRGELDKQIETVRSEGKLAISRIRSDAQTFDKERRAEAQAEHDRLAAEADLLLYQAESLKQRLMNAAYDSAGGRIELARQAAMNLKVREVVLNSNDPRVPSVLDLDQLASLLIGK